MEIGPVGSSITPADRTNLAALVALANAATHQTQSIQKKQPTPRLYVYGSYVDEPLMMKAGGSKYYFATNHLYSVAALTDSTGAVVERYKYDAYGRQGIMNLNGTVSYCPSDYGNFVGFQGRYHDWETGLVYFRSRYEDPQLGRFLNRMPWFGMNGMYLSNYSTLEMSPEWRSFMGGVLRDARGNYIQGRMGLYDFMLQNPANTVEPFSGAGTLTGAGIGSIFPGPGTIIGGIAGAIVDAGSYIVVGAAVVGAGAVGIAAGGGTYTPDGVGFYDGKPGYPAYRPDSSNTCEMSKGEPKIRITNTHEKPDGNQIRASTSTISIMPLLTLKHVRKSKRPRRFLGVVKPVEIGITNA